MKSKNNWSEKVYKNYLFWSNKIGVRIWFYYIIVLLFFALLLLLPISWVHDTKPTNFLDSFYLSVSAFSNTGLTVRNIGAEMTFFGQLVIFFLMIFGGVGLLFFKITFFQFLFYLTKWGDQYVDHNEQNYERGHFFQWKTRRMLIVSFWFLVIIEIIGFLFLFSIFYWTKWADSTLKNFYTGKFWNSAWHGIFHSVSATNNSGFDIFKSDASLKSFVGSYSVQSVFIIQFVLGGIGFPIFLNFWDWIRRFFKHKKSRLKISRIYFFTKFSLCIYFSLAIFGVLSVLLIESFNKSATKESGPGHFMAVLFNTLSARSAGYSTVNIEKYFSQASQYLITFLMWIGTSPLSTGGGIKTTVFGIVVLAFFMQNDKHDNLIVGQRSIKKSLVNHAQMTVLASIVFIAFGVFISLFMAEIIQLPETNLRWDINKNFFYFTSAISNVGLSTIDLTGKSNWIIFKIYTIILMMLGEVGISAAFAYRQNLLKKKYSLMTTELPI